LVEDINSNDIAIKKDLFHVILNGNRKVRWEKFRKISGFEFNNSIFCLMQNSFNEN